MFPYHLLSILNLQVLASKCYLTIKSENTETDFVTIVSNTLHILTQNLFRLSIPYSKGMLHDNPAPPQSLQLQAKLPVSVNSKGMLHDMTL